jgi:hypothetical protein
MYRTRGEKRRLMEYLPNPVNQDSYPQLDNYHMENKRIRLESGLYTATTTSGQYVRYESNTDRYPDSIG